NNGVLEDRVNTGTVIEYQFDFRPWLETGDSVLSVTWTLKAGQASISDQNLEADITSALADFRQKGSVLIKIAAETTRETYVTYLHIKVVDPEYPVNDYGFISND